ncbi:MAG: DUF4215 domain-containing protein [Deltaproteobacteria bacterium]|nr:DUF4215 domain-containing protein [Deltaproteobacteria bacterium]
MVDTMPSGPQRSLTVPGLVVLATILGPSSAPAAVVPGEIVVEEGAAPTGAAAAVDSLRAPFVNGVGEVAVVGFVSPGDPDLGFVFVGDQVVWHNFDDPDLTGIETSMGVSDAGGFIYSPTVSGDDAVWTHNGLLAVENTQAPGFAAGVTTTFHSRPTMLPLGTVYWLAGVNFSGGTNTEGRVLYRSPTATPADVVVVQATGDLIDGLAISAPSGIDFDFAVSDDDTHLIQVVLVDTGSTTDDGRLVVDGTAVAAEAAPSPTGDAWDNFDLVAINDAGDFVFTGDTAGSTTTDEFLGFNGAVVVREGDEVDGITLTGPATLRLLGINNLGQATYAWGISGSTEHMFIACDASDIVGTSQLVLSTDDELDLDGDGAGDGLFVSDFNASTLSNSKPLTDVGSVYVELDLDDTVTVREAIVRLPVECCGDSLTVGGEECDDGNADDTDGCLSTCLDATCGDGFVQTGVEACDDADLDDTDACLSSCEFASCGDGFVQAGVEECDDANPDDTDACLSTCAVASCGDGFVQAGVEECDDANPDDTDACLSSCQAASCGDGFVQVGVEECDDANPDDTDACLSSCQTASCGDGFVQVGVEECDDANPDDDDACPTTCLNAACGDGFVELGVEACDDANPDDTDACLSSCQAATCGDGFVQAGVEACDDANDDETDACLSSCEAAACGDGFVQAGVEECDDANTDDDDACSSECMVIDSGSTGADSSGDGDTEGEDESGSGGVATTGDGGSSGGSGGASGTPGFDTGALDDDGCGCVAGHRDRPLRGLLGSLLGLGLLGIGRGRRRGSRPRARRAG